MSKHVTCDLSKQQIIEIITNQFDQAHAEVQANPTDRNVWREETLRDLLKLIPVYEAEPQTTPEDTRQQVAEAAYKEYMKLMDDLVHGFTCFVE